LSSLLGCIVVDKPAGMTSHDVVAKARRALKERRVGHAGTLDPDATGVLVLGVGRATRLLRFATSLAKTYAGEIVLGTSTTTLDASGEVTGRFDMSAVTLEAAQAAAAALTGRIEQVPPMVSAVHASGRRLHELAREGVEVDRSPRLVEVRRFDLAPGEEPGVLKAVVECSSGTYVRCLAADLGAALGGGAHLRRLRRLAVGAFRVEEACSLDELSPRVLRPAGELVGHLASLVVDDEQAGAICHGRSLDRRVVGATGEGPWSLFDAAGHLLAVYEARDLNRLKALVVLGGNADVETASAS
jgi:tRNA pseudouridine55 synthase